MAMQSSSAARAWPHFVPRIELDAELKAVEGHLEQVYKRLDKNEADGAGLQEAFRELSARQAQELAARLSETEESVAREVAELRLELQRGLEGVRAVAGAEAEVRERMREIHTGRFEALDRALAAQDCEAKRLQAEIAAVPQIFATKTEHREAWRQLEINTEASSEELRVELDRVNKAKATHADVHQAQGPLHKKHGDLELASTVATTRIDALRRDLELVDGRLCDEERLRSSVEELGLALRQLERQVASGSTERRNIRADLQRDHEALRRMVLGFSEDFMEVKKGIRHFHELGEADKDLSGRCSKHEKDLELLEEKHNKQFEACQAALEENKASHANLQAVFVALQDELFKHIETSTRSTEQIRHNNTNAFFEQIDKAMTLHKSVADIEKGHNELQQTVRVHLPRL